MSSIDKPLVSIGIPTYNRPEGLRRTLDCILGQTYENIEVIVSDNCSPADQTWIVVEEAMIKDSRIKYYKQKQNIGAFENFKYVLRMSNGDYFMWAADDDEWSSEFIENCINIMRNTSVDTVMCQYQVHNRVTNTTVNCEVPFLSPELGVYANLKIFISQLTPSIIYGLHRRDALEFVFHYKEPFDFFDCMFVIALICNNGVKVIDKCLYTAGIDSENYIIKPAKKQKNRLLEYIPFIKHASKYIIHSSQLGVIKKIAITRLLLKVVANLFIGYEKDYRPFQTKIIKIILKLI